jgi:hypothetical protein
VYPIVAMFTPKRIPIILFAGVLSVAFTACRKDDPIPTPLPDPEPVTKGTFRLTLVPEWEGQPLALYTEYRNYMDQRVNVELLKMYWGELRLFNGPYEWVMKDVAYFNLGPGAVSIAMPVDTGMYAGLRAGLGVPNALNMSDPAVYSAGHPLNVNNGTYWTWATGYRFLMFEGRYDLDPQSTAPLIASYALHPGMEPCYLPLEFQPSGGVRILPGAETELVVKVAVDRFFHSPTGNIDLATENTAHGQNLPLAIKLAENAVQSMSVE